MCIPYFSSKLSTGQVELNTVIVQIQINQPTRCSCFTRLLLEGLCVAEHISGASTPIIRSLQLH